MLVKEGIAQNLYYRWSKDFLEAGKKRLSGDTSREANTDEVKELRSQARQLKEVCDARRRHIEAYEALQENYRALAAMIAEDKRLDVVAAAQHLKTMMKACINHKLNLTTGGHNIRIDIIPNGIATKCLNLGAKLLQDEADALAIP